MCILFLNLISKQTFKKYIQTLKISTFEFKFKLSRRLSRGFENFNLTNFLLTCIKTSFFNIYSYLVEPTLK